MYYWSMSPADFYDGFAGVWGGYGYLNGDDVNYINAVHPVISVTTDNWFTSGDGTASNPYILTE